MRKSVKIILGVVFGFSVLCIEAGLSFYFRNKALPTHSQNPQALNNANQALLLDRLAPGWKGKAFKDAFLEDLLAEAVK